MRGKVSNHGTWMWLVSCAVVLAMSPVWLASFGSAFAEPQAPTLPPEQPAPAHLDKDQLRQLVAPIALYPDPMLAQILAAAAYPTQIVEADRFLQQNPNLKGAALGAEVDKQDWDPSVKAITQYPSVVANLDKNLSWTSELGDANYNQPQDVMKAVQYLRKKAKDAGKLQSTPQQVVTDQGDDVVIQPANPQVVYVPMYDPTLIYGYPLVLWPGLYPWWGVPGPFITFGIGFGIGPFFGFGWGWHAWGFDWIHGGLFFGGRPYAFHSHAFYDRAAYFHGNFRGYSTFGRGDRSLRGFAGARGPERSFGNTRGAFSARGRTGAFGGFAHGGDTRTFSSRGRASFGGGMRGGGGRR